MIQQWRLLVLAPLLLAQPCAAGQAEPEDDAPIVVTGHKLPIIVRGHVPRCRPREGDPVDSVDLAMAAALPGQQVIRADSRTGELALFPDDYPETGLEAWQRVGERLDTYVFRVPEDGQPLCIGARGWAPVRFAQLRRAFVAHPYWGQIVRFSASVATRKVDGVTYWLASGSGAYVEGRQVELGSNIVSGSNNVLARGAGVVAVETSFMRPITGSNGWTKIGMTIGPIPCAADQISYGVTLVGGGDVWLGEPEFEVVPDSELSARWRHEKKAKKYRNCEAQRARQAQEEEARRAMRAGRGG